MMRNRFLPIILGGLVLFYNCTAPATTDIIENVEEESSLSEVWVPDLGNGNYKNPIIHSDYSDPDVVRAGDDYYMTASSFNCAPGLPILHSNDLVNWKIVNYALPRITPDENFSIPQHGNGVWAPAIRYHNNEFYIYWGDPDYGIYMIKSSDPLGQWSEPHLVKSGKGWIDACPLWVEDGKAYLVHAFAGSRSGIKSILVVHEMNPDGTALLDDGVLIFDGHIDHTTVEGPKFYKKNGYYYVFAPAGGVTPGWQLALRSKNVFGPYEVKVVLHQGNTNINGPHQGGWVSTQTGEDWFIHFQDNGAYGRIVHLQPVNWVDNWPMMGIDINDDGIGEPVLEYKKPDVGKTYPLATPQSSDEFNEPILGLQWQWQANPSQGFGFPSGRLGFLRLNALPTLQASENLWQAPNLLLQKFTAKEFTATSSLEFYPSLKGDRAGLIIMGMSYAYIAMVKEEDGLYLKQVNCLDAMSGNSEEIIESVKLSDNNILLRVKVEEDAICSFYYSTDGTEFHPLGKEFKATKGRWIGAKVGLFSVAEEFTNNSGYSNIDWFRIENY